TVREAGPRLIGNVEIEVDLGAGPRRLAGFENHGRRTYLSSRATAPGRVIRGFGNNGKDGYEGVHEPNVIGTYLHGPLLPKNAWLADRLVQLALAPRATTCVAPAQRAPALARPRGDAPAEVGAAGRHAGGRRPRIGPRSGDARL